MNLWKNIPSGDKVPDIVNVIVEVISGSRDKYEYNIEYETFVLFPVEYGFSPQTWGADEDPLDVMILSNEPLEVGCLVKAKPIGVLVMEDEKGEDSKILTIPISDPRFDGYNDIKDVHPHKLKEIREFFETYKRLEPHKWVKFKSWKNSKYAKKMIERAIELYGKRLKY
jgi:inorganic pyrophosphatase